MQITLTYKKVFGNDLYYPADDTAKVICNLGGFKSFTANQVDVMKKAQWELDIKADIPA
jgi:hypothetical protein